jgi:hypothetical protein
MSILEDILGEELVPGTTPLSEADELAALISQLQQGKKSTPNQTLALNPYQSRFLLAPDLGFREVLYSGSVGGGKSLSLCLALLRYVEQRDTTVILSRLTLQDLKRSTLVSLLRPETQWDGSVRPPLLPVSAIKGYNKVDGIISLHNGSNIITIGAQDPEKVRSINAAAAFIEEASELNEEQYTAVFQRCRSPSRLPNAVMSCTNPKSKAHFLYRRFFTDKDPTRTQLTVNAYSNPYLSKDYVRSLEKLAPRERDRMLLGKWTSDDSAVFPGFDASIHVKPLTGTYSEYVISQDYGGGAGGSAMHLMARDQDGAIYCLREFYAIGPSHSKVLEWMEQHRGLVYSRCIYDSANAALRIDMEARGWTCIGCLKDIEGSVSMVNSRLHDRKVLIDPSCVQLIQQIESASREPGTGLINKLKNWDALDSFRYGLTALTKGEGAIPVKPLQVLSGIAIRSKR